MTIELYPEDLRSRVIWVPVAGECTGHTTQGEPPTAITARGHLTLQGKIPSVEPALKLSFSWIAHGRIRKNRFRGCDFKLPQYDADSGSFSFDPEIEVLSPDSGEVLPVHLYDQVAVDLIVSYIEWEVAAACYLPRSLNASEQPADADNDINMQSYVLPSDKSRDVRFVGKRITRASSHSLDGPRNSRWTELDLYRTKGNKWVCHQIGRSILEGEHDRFSVHVAANDSELVDQLGVGWLAKELYDEVGVDQAIDIA